MTKLHSQIEWATYYITSQWKSRLIQKPSVETPKNLLSGWNSWKNIQVYSFNIANYTLSSWLEGCKIFQCKFYCTIGKDIVQSFLKSYDYWTRYKCVQSTEIVEHDFFSWEGYSNIFCFIWSNQFDCNFVDYL